MTIGTGPIATTPIAATSGGVVPIVVTGVPVLRINQGAYYSFQCAATGGLAGGYTWSIANAPPGITISATGLVNGYATAAGAFANVIVTATDTGSNTGSLAAFTLTVINFAQVPATLLTHNNFGPYAIHARTPYGYGTPSGPIRTSWIGLEVLHSGDANTNVRVSWIGVEVLHSIAIAVIPPVFKAKRPWLMTRKHRRPHYTIKQTLDFVPTYPAFDELHPLKNHCGCTRSQSMYCRIIRLRRNHS